MIKINTKHFLTVLKMKTYKMKKQLKNYESDFDKMTKLIEKK